MARSVPILSVALLVASFAVGGAGQGAAAPEPRLLTLGELGHVYADAFHSEPAPEGLSPLEAKGYWLQERPVLGRSIEKWLDHVRADYSLDTAAIRGSRSDAPADLVHATLALDALLGVSPTAAEIARMEAQSRGLDPVVRGEFARLVVSVAEAYAAQVPLAARLNAAFATEFDPTEPFLSPALRDEMDARAAGLVAALNEFRAATEGQTRTPVAAAATCDPLFTDPEGLVVLGNSCDNTYTRSGTLPDPVLLVDPAGNDVYLNGAGGADPSGILAPGQFNRLVLSVVLDQEGDDEYRYVGPPSTVQGAGAVGAIGILVDVLGSDLYYAKMTRTNLISALTQFNYYFDGGAQGYGFGGVGIQLDGFGSDTYRFEVASTFGRHVWAFAQGFGGAGGLGISADASGWDRWITVGLGITGGNGFQGLYTQGTGFYGGTGIMLDAGLGNDVYHNWDNSTTTDYYAQGFGAFGGLGILADDGGSDDYVAVSKASNPWISPLLHCAYGTASLGGVGVMVEGGGDDRYFGDSISNRKAHTMDEGFGGIGAGVGLFFDLGGVDQHIMQAHGATGSILSGRGVVDSSQIFDNVGLGEGANVVGMYLDVGGVDTYEGPGRDNGAWVAGADVNTV